MSWLAAASVLCAAVAVRLGSGLALNPAVGWVGRLGERRTDRAVGAGLAPLCEHVARSLRSGVSLRSALVAAPVTDVGPALAEDLRAIRRRLDAGAAMDDALRAWALRRQHVGGVGLTVAALGLAAEVGGSMAEAVDGVADTLRAEVALAEEVRAMAAQAEASAALIAVLPAVFALVAGVADPETLAFFVSEPVGMLCVAGGLGLDAVGFVWMRRISRQVR